MQMKKNITSIQIVELASTILYKTKQKEELCTHRRHGHPPP